MSIVFKRTLSTFIQNYIDAAAASNSRVYNTEVAAEIQLRDGTFLRYATKAITIDTLSQGTASTSISSLVFTARLSGAPDLRHTQTKAPDSATLELVNIDYIITSAIPTSNRIFDGAFVTIYLCFPKPAGTYEGLIYFVGALQAVTGDDQTAQMSVVSDLSIKTATVGKEITQRCMNVLGDAWCGVTHLPVGATCTNIFHDKEGGCSYWGGVYNGGPFVNPTAALNGVISGTGDGFEHGHTCPGIETTWFPSPNGGDIHARDLRAGEVIFSPTRQPVIIEKAEVRHVDYRYKITSGIGAGLIASATHRCLRSVDDPSGYPLVEWFNKDHTLLASIPTGLYTLANPNVNMGNISKRRWYRFQPLGPGQVLDLQVSGPQTYLAGDQRGFYLANHNNKGDVFWETPY